MRMSTSMIYQQNLSGVTNNQSLWMQSGSSFPAASACFTLRTIR